MKREILRSNLNHDMKFDHTLFFGSHVGKADIVLKFCKYLICWHIRMRPAPCRLRNGRWMSV